MISFLLLWSRMYPSDYFMWLTFKRGTNLWRHENVGDGLERSLSTHSTKES